MKGIGSATAPRRILWHKLRNLEEALAGLNRANERRMREVCALAKAAAPALGRHNADRASTVATMLLGRCNGQAPFRKERLVLPNGAYQGRGLLTFEKNHGPVSEGAAGTDEGNAPGLDLFSLARPVILQDNSKTWLGTRWSGHG
jgi:hypothetical protein